MIKNKKKSKKRIGPKIRSGLKMRKSSTYNVIKKIWSDQKIACSENEKMSKKWEVDYKCE